MFGFPKKMPYVCSRKIALFIFQVQYSIAILVCYSIHTTTFTITYNFI